MAIIAFIAVSISTSYGQAPDKRTVKARENLKEEQKDVVNAKQNLKDAQKNDFAEFQEFKKESEIKIENNEKSIADLKVRISKTNTKDKAANQKKVNKLEQKNENLKRRLAKYKKDERQDRWTTFKSEFNNDMTSLGKDLKNFTSKK